MSEKHNQLVDLAIAWLRSNNYNDIEVEVKVPSDVPARSYPYRRYYSLDVVGRDGSKKVVVECGGSKSSKLDTLLGLFDEVWVLPYGAKTPYQWETGKDICQNCGHIV